MPVLESLCVVARPRPKIQILRPLYGKERKESLTGALITDFGRSEMPQPTVSALIPCYNTRDCVLSAIESALDQEGYEVEVVVVDDASVDGTPDVVEAAYPADERVRLIRQMENRGPSAARNIALQEARGIWVGLLDADDTWLPNRVATLLTFAEEADFIADNILAYDVAAGVATGPIYRDLGNMTLGMADFLKPSAPDKHDFGYLQPLLRRDFIVENGLAWREDVRVGEDLLFNLEFVAAGGRARYVDKALYVYATPVGQQSRQASPFSRTVPDNAPLIAALSHLRDQLAGTLTPELETAFDERIADLEYHAPIAAFHIARVRFQVVEMLRLLIKEPRVRRRVYERLKHKFLGGY